MQELNRQILIYMNSLTEYKIIEKMTLCFSDTPIFILPIFLIIWWIYFTYKEKNNDKKNDLLLMFYSTVIAVIINLSIQQFITVDRPEKALEWVWKLLLNHIPDASFPSDHAAVSISFLTWLFLANYKKFGFIFLIAVILMNISRVILWVHWPFDIVWGLVVWVSSSFIVFKILKTNKYVVIINNFIIKMMWYIKM